MAKKTFSSEKDHQIINGYTNGDYRIKPFSIMLPKMSVYAISYNSGCIFY